MVGLKIPWLSFQIIAETTGCQFSIFVPIIVYLWTIGGWENKMPVQGYRYGLLQAFSQNIVHMLKVGNK